MAKIQIFAKKVALGIREVYMCEGVSLRQHNEPAGDQDMWHYHLHIFPRRKNDDLYLNHLNKKFVPVEEREVYAKK